MAQLNLREYRLLAPEMASIFGQPWWLDALCPNAWNAIVHKSQNCTILWPFHFKKKLGFSAMLMPEVSLFGGPFVQGSPIESDWKSVIQEINSFDKIAYQTTFNFQVPSAFELNGFQVKQRKHYVLHKAISPEKNFNTNTKRKLKKAAEDVKLKETRELSNFIKLANASYQTQGVSTPFKNDTLLRLMSACKAKNIGKIIEAKADGDVLAASWIVSDQLNHYYFLSGVDRTKADKGAVAKIVAEAIKQAFEVDKNFNFYGSEVPGVARFMKGFGATEEYSYFLTKTNSSLLKLAKKILH